MQQVCPDTSISTHIPDLWRIGPHTCTEECSTVKMNMDQTHDVKSSVKMWCVASMLTLLNQCRPDKNYWWRLSDNSIYRQSGASCKNMLPGCFLLCYWRSFMDMAPPLVASSILSQTKLGHCHVLLKRFWSDPVTFPPSHGGLSRSRLKISDLPSQQTSSLPD